MNELHILQDTKVHQFKHIIEEMKRLFFNNNSMSQFLKKFSKHLDDSNICSLLIQNTQLKILFENTLDSKFVYSCLALFHKDNMEHERYVFNWNNITKTPSDFFSDITKSIDDDPSEIQKSESEIDNIEDSDFNDDDFDDLFETFGGGRKRNLLSYLNQMEPWFAKDQKLKQNSSLSSKEKRLMQSSIVWQFHYPLVLTPLQFEKIKDDFYRTYKKDKSIKVDIIEACRESQNESIGKNTDVKKMCMSLIFGPKKNHYVCPYTPELFQLIKTKLDLPDYIITHLEKLIQNKVYTNPSPLKFIGFSQRRQLPSCFKRINNNNKNSLSNWAFKEKHSHDELSIHLYDSYFKEWNKLISTPLKCGLLPPKFYTFFTENLQRQMRQNIHIKQISRDSNHTTFLRINIGNGLNVHSFFETMLHVFNWNNKKPISLRIFIETLLKETSSTTVLEGTLDRYFHSSRSSISSYQNFLEYILSKSIQKNKIICWNIIQHSLFFQDINIILIKYCEKSETFSIPCQVSEYVRKSKASKCCYILEFERNTDVKFQPIIYLNSSKYTTIKEYAHEAFQTIHNLNGDIPEFETLYSIIKSKITSDTSCVYPILSMTTNTIRPITFVDNETVSRECENIGFKFEIDIVDIYHKVIAKLYSHKHDKKSIIIPVRPQPISPKYRTQFLDDIDTSLLYDAFETYAILQSLSETIPQCTPLYIHVSTSGMNI